MMLRAGDGADDRFTLHDLKVEVVATGRPMVCDHREGEYFLVLGERIVFPEDGRRSFPMYPLAALLPLLPAKQRDTAPNDWMTTDAEVACPDPHCGARFRITRIGRRTFRHSETTAVPLPLPRRRSFVTRTGGEPSVATAELRPGYRISRLVKGGWQLAGDHGPVEFERAVADMTAFVDAGIDTFDCADIYTGVEAMIGTFLARLAAARGGACAAG